MPIDYSKWEILDRELAAEEAPEECVAGCGQQAQSSRDVSEDIESDDDWATDVDETSYKDFTIKRTSRVVKKRGTGAFRKGDMQMAEAQWRGGLVLVEKVGLAWPSAADLYVQLKCNLSQLYITQGRWSDAQKAASDALIVDPGCEKALFRRALVRMNCAQWMQAKQDLEELRKRFPENAEACRLLSEAREAIRMETQRRGGVPLDLSHALQEITPDGTLRKLCVLAEPPASVVSDQWGFPWFREEWLGASRVKPVLSVNVVVRTVAGEELFSTVSSIRLPGSPEELAHMREVMREVARLDDAAGKKPRTPQEFFRKDRRQPLRWRVGDPAVYVGFDLAVRSMRFGERASFEIDQPLLEPSVREFYKADGGVARAAGLPDFMHHIDDQKLELLAEELPEWDIDLDNMRQRTVRAEFELLEIGMFRDVSRARTGEFLLRVAFPGHDAGRWLRQGMQVVGDFCVTGALDGSVIYSVDRAVWILGLEGSEGLPNAMGQSAYIPKCIGQAIHCATYDVLREGAQVEVRMQSGPTPYELNPKLAAKYDWKRALSHKPPVSIHVEVHSVVI